VKNKSLYFTARVHINKCVQEPVMAFQYSAVPERRDRRKKTIKRRLILATSMELYGESCRWYGFKKGERERERERESKSESMYSLTW
jgi:hypothetical protein